MTDITIATLKRFVNEHGNIKFLDLTGKTRMLQPGLPDAFDLAKRADRFFYEGKWYTRKAFTKLLDEI